MARIIPTLNDLQLLFLLWFSKSLTEQLTEKHRTITQVVLARLNNEMEHVVKDASTLMSFCFAQSVKGATSRAKGEALRVFFSCVDYAQPTLQRTPDYLHHIRDLIDQAAQCLLDHDLDLEALAIFRDILDRYPAFFQPQHMSMLAEVTYEHIRPKLLQALSDQDADGPEFGKFVVAFGCANIQQVIEEPGNQLGSIAIVQILCDILATTGYPGDEDQVSIHTIEFWNTYIEYVNDVQGSKDADDPDPEWLNNAKQLMLRLVELLWTKMWIPPKQVADTWGDAEREGLTEFRSDSEDPLLSIFVLCGRDMLHQLVSLSIQSLQAEQWRGVEAALFCLNKLADNVLEDISLEDAMVNLFRSTLFTDIADYSRAIPSQTRRTAIELLGSYGSYIERHPEFLPDTLRFLFASLEMAGLAAGSAKSIVSLCSSCRAYLTGELPGFMVQYQRFLESKTSDPYTKQKIMGAIAAIIQALKPESAKSQPLLALLAHVEQDAKEAERWATSGDMEMAELIGVSSLECLAGIGKAMQVPDDVPIDIYDDDEQVPSKSNYWESEEGRAVQQRIVGCFSVLSVVGAYREAIDAVCQVLKSGFTETEPGPFVLPASVTVSFIQQCSIDTPALDLVLSTASILITQHSRKESQRIDDEVRSIYHTTTGFMQALGQPSVDPGTAHACIEVLTRLMPYYTHVLLEDISAFALDFTLKAIEGIDKFPKRSAYDFWTKLIEPQTAPTSAEVQQRINQVLQAYGPKLCFALVYQIGGQEERSYVDELCKPLKALLLYQSGTQTWLQQALADPSFPSTRVSMDRRATFLRMVSSTRSDGRKLKDIVKAFWAESKGTIHSFSM
jgi:hypothetical protein